MAFRAASLQIINSLTHSLLTMLSRLMSVLSVSCLLLCGCVLSVLLGLKLLTLNVNIDKIKTQKSHTNVSKYQNSILPLLIRIYRVPILKFHQYF